MTHSASQLSGNYRTALVTGASSGIGSALATALVDAGLKVYGTTRSPEAPGLPGIIQWLPFEGATAAGLQAFIRDNEQLLTKIDILVNNSGSSYFGEASSIPEAARLRQHHLLYEAPRKLSETVIRPMRDRTAGAIVNVSSLAARFPIPYMEDYSSSKARLSSYTVDLMGRNHDTKVVVIDFQPGDYRTKFNHNLTRYGEPDTRSDRVWRQLEKNLRKGPAPEKAARDVIAALQRGKSCTVTSGSLFQSKLAPVAGQLLPERFVRWAIRKYYRI